MYSLASVGLAAVLTLSNIGAVHALDASDCDCYVTGGPSSASYQFHSFFDFRSINSNGTDYDNEPAKVTASQSSGKEPSQPGYLSSSDFSSAWTISNWTQQAQATHPITSVYSKQNVYIQKNPDDHSKTLLALRASRNSNFSSSAEIEFVPNMLHASIRAYARVRGDAGAVAGIFTYLNDTNESDIEMLTKDPASQIHYTNQPGTANNGDSAVSSQATVQLPNGGVQSDWTVHRLDWLPNLSAWYANDTLLANTTSNVPQLASNLIFNMWSNGGNWSGNMSIGSAAYLEIQWVDMVFNTSTSATNSSAPSTCAKKCSIDKVKNVGTPQRVSGSPRSTSAGGSRLFVLFGAVFWLYFYI